MVKDVIGERITIDAGGLYSQFLGLRGIPSGEKRVDLAGAE
jgi:hypothetical protein